jgi:hypothetical protein
MKLLNEIKLKHIYEFFISERHRIHNFIPVGIGIGICIYFSLDNEPCVHANAAAFFFALLSFLFIHKFVDFEENAIGYMAKFAVAAFLTISLGFFVSQIRTNSVNTFMPTKKIKLPLFLAAVVESCEKTEKGMKFIVSSIKNKKKNRISKLCKKFNKLHLTWNGDRARNSKKNYQPGTKILFKTLLSPIYPRSFPGAYDFRKQQFFKGISSRGFIIAEPKILNERNQNSFNIFIECLRHNINKKIEFSLKYWYIGKYWYVPVQTYPYDNSVHSNCFENIKSHITRLCYF